MLDQAIELKLSHRRETELYRQAKRVTFTLFEELFQHVETIICELIAAETRRPITYNSFVKHEKGTQLARYQQARTERRVAEYFETLEAQGQKIVGRPEQKKKASDANWVATTLGKDDYQREVDALATPMAYYKVTTKSLVDNIARLFENGLMSSFQALVFDKLTKDLRATDTEYCAQLLAEDPEREKQRAELVAEKTKLEVALAELYGLPAAHLPN